jgi:hypothetical protein
MNLRLPAAILLCLAAATVPAATWDEEPPGDWVVSRANPEGKTHLEPRTALGVLLPSFHKLPLYEAYRLLVLGEAKIEAEDRTSVLPPWRPDEDAIDAWKAARETIVPDAPPHEPGHDRPFGGGVMGAYLNCGSGAFRLAIETLGELRKRKIPLRDQRAWVAAQDAVFGFCTFVPDAPGEVGKGRARPPAVPAPLPKGAPVYLRQLRAYQVAAAHFYRGDHERARQAFEAIARDARHPLRAWAAHAALRAILRGATLDLSFERAFAEVADAPAEERRRKLVPVVARLRERERTAFQELRTRAEALLANPDLAAVHGPTRALLEHATIVLYPELAFAQLTARLGRLEENPYREDVLERWQQLSDTLDFGARPDLEALRITHPFLDWIRTIQRCTENPASTNAGDCAAEHRHALQVWSERKERAWLVAVLVTARRLGAEDAPALAAARKVAADAPERLTLLYHAARVLLVAGRRDEARAIADEVLADQELLGDSARHLFLQIRLSATPTLAEIGPYVLRAFDTSGAFRLGADGDELLNRTLASEDLLTLANAPTTPDELRPHLKVAAWFRADVAGRDDVAERAAKEVRDEVPEFQEDAKSWLANSDPEVRRLLMVILGTKLHASPVVGWQWPSTRGALGDRRRKPVPFSNWCSFDPARFAAERQAQRTLPLPAITPAPGAAQEQARLRAAGSWGRYAAERFLRFLDESVSLEPEVRRQTLQLLLLFLEDTSCPEPDADRLRAEIEHRLAGE